jgi:two-component system chemotaxis response regulator CheB
LNPLLQEILLEKDDFDFFSKMLQEISGIFLSEKKIDLVQGRLRGRLDSLKLSSFHEYREYLSHLPKNHGEWQRLTNELTTNKTEFFREIAHFDYLIQKFIPNWEKRSSPADCLNIWSAACSTGEEPYSLAIAAEDYFKGRRDFRITASDIDTEALSYAINGVYPKERLLTFPSRYDSYLIRGKGELSQWRRISDEIHKKIEFLRINLSAPPYPTNNNYDVIFCRNVFIYFQAATIERIIRSFYDAAKEGSILAISHSETLQGLKNPWEYVAPSIFIKRRNRPQRRTPASPSDNATLATVSTSVKKKVLIVDDSKTITRLLTNLLSKDPGLQVVAEINHPKDIEAAIQQYKPDVMTLDIHMPMMDGCAVLEKLLPKYPIPTVMISSISMEEGPAVLRALELGAVDYIQKPSFSELALVESTMIEKVKNAANSRVQRRKTYLTRRPSHVQAETASLASTLIAIGSSTGGTEALAELLTQLPSNIPPILIVQHIPPVFSKAFANRLNELCPFEVVEAADGDEVKCGRVLIAPGGKHMILSSRSNGFQVKIIDTPPVNRHKPSVDVLFDSVCDQLGRNSIGVILTGMGSDGAKGLLKLKQAGARTIAQDEKSCVVFGMPKEAIRLGGACEITALSDIPSQLIRWLKK